jgi:hypothetical protein
MRGMHWNIFQQIMHALSTGKYCKSIEEYVKGHVYIHLGLCNLQSGDHICNDALSNEGITLCQ